jgi:hypothetical protein
MPLLCQRFGRAAQRWKALTGATVTRRVTKATMLCDKLQRMPWGRAAKLAVVKSLVLPTALYGCEAAPSAEAQLGKLSISIAKAIKVLQP